MPPFVAAGSHFTLNFIADSLDNDNCLDGRSMISMLHQLLLFAGTALLPRKVPSQTTSNFGFAVDNSVTESVSAESAENDAMNGADAGAGQHGNGQFGNHRHVKNIHGRPS